MNFFLIVTLLLVSAGMAYGNDHSCDKHFIFFPGGPEGGPFGTVVTMAQWLLLNTPVVK